MVRIVLAQLTIFTIIQYYYFLLLLLKLLLLLLLLLYNQVSNLFISLRPDIAIVGPNKNIDVLELTICHETNVSKLRNYKETRYSNLHRDLKQEYLNYNLNIFTVKVTTLGLITDFFKFCIKNMKTLLTDPLENEIMRSTVSSSFQIHCNRNNHSQ